MRNLDNFYPNIHIKHKKPQDHFKSSTSEKLKTPSI